MKIIDNIEGEDIVWTDAQTIEYTAKAAIDDDGVGDSHGDPDFQNDTTLHWNGRPLNADVDRYIVLPPQIIAGVAPIVLGSLAEVTNTTNGRTCRAVVGDVGPHRKIGEMSISCAQALGIPSSPITGGIDDHVIKYVVHPGVPAVLDGKVFVLQPR